MDELGIPSGVIGASVLKPTMPGTIIVGPALTVRNILQRIDPLTGARDHVNQMAEFEAHNLAHAGRRAGDRRRAQHLQHGRHLGPDRQAPGRGRRDRAGRHARHRRIRARSAIRSGRATSRRSPASGGIETVEINGPIQIGEVQVAPGDLVVADDTGVCFIPRDLRLEVLEDAEKKARSEAKRVRRSTAASRCPTCCVRGSSDRTYRDRAFLRPALRAALCGAGIGHRGDDLGRGVHVAVPALGERRRISNWSSTRATM